MSTIPKKGSGKKSIPLVIEKDEDGIYVVECTILSGCYAQGETEEEAIKNIEEVILLALEDEDNKAVLDAYSPVQISFQTITI